MDAVKDAAHAQLAELRMKIDDNELLHSLEQKYNIPKERIVVGGVLVIFFAIAFGLTAASLCSIIGFAYPSYKSFEAIEKRTGSGGGPEVTQWLIYWVVFSFFSIIEVFVDTLLYWIPFYWAFKVAFLLWAMLPQTRGAKFLYDSFLKDFLRSNESKIDAALENASKTAASVAKEAKEVASNMGANLKSD
ncbi:hypothetical protein THAOC_08407 [Thalassiosira oceanica]|uniref:Receptor expression-enhancing protein n=1 Tax=Thalassiosira oceanica TaxID=159749 RepID=K0SY02_THAOC|nr:hypothetical protein THAOC_08407 [Thalassiosira oceanica]|mmetsp:Transcript_17535/g.40877  ORF Transcript_17535/g.40877 Transcript_17535/m.40877 type:complete len:190 (+) Transcript_17535:92-661(+)|eukprot:EJK70245.1 hypothetical protein THAOC_08407 [Thalassiosira oceanica]